MPAVRFYTGLSAFLPELGIVSDAWPSLERVPAAAGMRGHFSSFVVSSRLGVSKPAESMYLTALRDLGVEASDAVFVDDRIRNRDGAAAVGVRPLVLCRSWPEVADARVLRPRHRVLRSLTEL